MPMLKNFMPKMVYMKWSLKGSCTEAHTCMLRYARRCTKDPHETDRLEKKWKDIVDKSNRTLKDKLVEMTHLNETIYGMGVAASLKATRTPAGNFQPDVMLANVRDPGPTPLQRVSSTFLPCVQTMSLCERFSRLEGGGWR